jgi:hypothetical protein
MSRVRDFFLEEASTCLTALRSATADQADVIRLYNAARLLRGNAQLARYGAIAVMAGQLERRLRPVAREQAPWTAALEAELAWRVRDLEQAILEVRDGLIQQDERKDMTEEQKPAEMPEVPIDELEYTGNAALERALSLRTALEDGIVAGEPVGTLLDEVFDLIRLGSR